MDTAIGTGHVERSEKESSVEKQSLDACSSLSHLRAEERCGRLCL